MKSHVAHVLTKTGLRDRVQVVVRAYETGLVEPGEHLGWGHGRDPGVRDPAAPPVPGHHRPRGDAAARRGRVGRVEPVPRVRARGRRAVAALCRGGGRRRLADPGARRRCRSTSRCPRSGPEQAHKIVRARRLRDGQGEGGRAGPVAGRRPGAGRGGTRRPRARRAGCGSTRTAPGRSTTRWPRSACWTRPPEGSSTSSSPARRSRSWRRCGARSTCRSRRTSRSGGPSDPYRVRDLEAADIAVLKVQPLGGVRACLRIAEEIGLPVVVSSALETSVGIAAGLALAGALPSLPYACGLATVQLLTADVVAEPLLPVDGRAAGPAADRRPARAGPARGHRRPGRPLGGPAGRGAGAACERHRAGPLRRLVAGRGRRPRGGAGARVAQRAARLRGVRRRRGRAAPAAHPDRRADRRVPGARADQGRLAGRGRLHVRHGGRQPAPGGARGPPRRRAAWWSSPPTGRCGCAAPTPTRPPTRSGSSGRRCRPSTSPGPIESVGPGLVHLNVQLDDPLVPAGPLGSAAVGGSRTVAQRPSSNPDSDTRARARPAHGRGRRRRRRPARPTRSRSKPAGRCWPSRPAGRAPGRRCGPTGCCWPPSWPTRSSGWCVFGHPTLSRPVQRLLVARGRGGARRGPGLDAAVRRHPVRRPARGGRTPTTPPGSPPGRRPTPRCRGSSTPLIDEAGFTAYHVAGAVSRALPPGGHLVVGASNPIRDLDLMATAYDVGSRRKVIANRGLSGIDGTVSTAIGASLARTGREPQPGADGRRDVPARRHRAGDRAGRAATGPDDRGRQRRRRLDLRHPRAGGGRVRARLRAALRHPAPRRPRRALPGHPHRRTGGSTRWPSSTTHWPARTAASRWSRRWSTAPGAASWTWRSARCGPP